MDTQRFPTLVRYLFLLLSLWTLVLCVWIYRFSIRGGGLECWDGYERCAWGANIWHDVRHLDFRLFWKHTNNQIVWPFLHSWVTGFLFLLFGPTLTGARILCLLSLAGSALIVLKWFSHRPSSYSLVAGVIAWGLLTTSPAVLQHSVSVMSELPGLFLILAVLIFLPDRDNPCLRRSGLAGFLLGLLFLYKYNFAFLTYFAVGIAVFKRERCSLRRLWTKHYACVFGIPLVLLALWFIPLFPQKKEGLVGFALNNPEVRMAFGFENLFYYPRLIASIYFMNPYVAIAALTLAAIARPITNRLSLQDPLTACFLVHFIAAVIHPMKDPRFIFIPMGLLYLLTGEAAGALLRRFMPIPVRFAPHGSLVFAALVLLQTLLYQSGEYRIPQTGQDQYFMAPVRAMIDHITPNDQVALLVSHDLISPPAISFYLITALDRCQSNEDGSPQGWTYQFLFEKGEDVRRLPMEERLRRLRYFLSLYQSNTVITVRSTQPDRIPRFDALFGGTDEYAALVPQLQECTLIYEREFQHSKVRVCVYSYNPAKTKEQ